MAQSETDSLRMELAEAQTNEAALRSALDETEGQVWCRAILSTFYEETEESSQSAVADIQMVVFRAT